MAWRTRGPSPARTTRRATRTASSTSRPSSRARSSSSTPGRAARTTTTRKARTRKPSRRSTLSYRRAASASDLRDTDLFLFFVFFGRGRRLEWEETAAGIGRRLGALDLDVPDPFHEGRQDGSEPPL